MGKGKHKRRIFFTWYLLSYLGDVTTSSTYPASALVDHVGQWFDHHHDAKLVQLDIRNKDGEYSRPWDINNDMRKGTLGMGTVIARQWIMAADGEKPVSHVSPGRLSRT